MKNRYIYNLGILISLMVLTFQAFGQQIVFNKLLPEDTPNFGAVGRITQDEKGTMWFATRTGLYSYDGNQMTSFRNNPSDPNSLSSNMLIPVCADNNGIIWTGSLGGGLNHLDTETGVFTHFRHNPDEPASLSSDTVNAILRDENGTLWVGTHGGLDKFDQETNSFIHYRYNASDTASLSNNQVIAIYEDKQGMLWIGTGSAYPSNGGGPDDGGLNRMNKNTGTFTHYRHDPTNNKSLINNKISAIFEDNKGTLWIGTAKNGIHKMDKQQGTFEQIFSDPKHPENYSGPNVSSSGLPFDVITFITQDAAGTCWFGTVGSGFYSFDPETEKIERFDGPQNSSSGFTDYRARSGFTSRDGILWIGTPAGNIYHMDPTVRKIKHTSISGASVSSFYEEPNGDFWIGTDRELFKTERNSENTKRYLTDDYKYDVRYNLGFMVNGDSAGNIWVGTAVSLNLWDKKNEKFIAYKHDPKNDNTISNDFIISTYEDSKSNFWIGTLYGLNLMDRKTRHFTRFYAHPENTNIPGENVVMSILEDKSGKLWISNFWGGGVNLFIPENREFKSYLKGKSFVNLYQDTDDVLWAISTTGLFRYNPDKDDFEAFSAKGYITGIFDVRSIIEDKQKNLWLTTRNEILKINPHRDEISVFGQNYGVGQSDFNFKSAYLRNNGEIYFGDRTGYFSFFPNEFLENLKTPEIVFTSLRLSDRKLNPGDGGPLKEDLNAQKEIKFQYDQNVFSIDLAIIDYANPKQNRVSYFLENYDISWRNASSERRAYYFNVPPGKYTFRVKGVNSYGGWAEKKLDIIVLPPWYRTWLAYAIYAILFVAAVFGVDRFQRARLLQIEKEKNRVRELAHAKEIEKAYTELKATQTQLIQSEKMASLGELTAGIAHEIQNPLNFVNNFSELSNELMEEMKEELEESSRQYAAGSRQSGEEKLNLAKEIASDIKQNLEKINHHGKRADAIVKGMLQHSRTSNGVKEPTDINALADEYLRLSYHGLRAKDKSFNADFKTEFDPNLPKVNVIPQDIGRVLLNLINNAFYAVNARKLATIGTTSTVETTHALSLPPSQPPTPYKPTVTVSTKNLGDRIEISVMDNGPGIPEEIKDKIFQPFFTTKPTGQGTGLGLSLSYDIVKAHGGELNISSSPGGTIFKILLNK